MGRGNKDNLIKNEDLTPEERRKSASRAGKASVEARKRKKTMREALEMLMFKVKLPEEHRKMLEKEGFTEEDFNHQTVITRSLIAKAESGDVQAYNAICAMIGEKPAEKMEMSGSLLQNLHIERYKPNPSGKIVHSEDEITD